MDRIAGTVTDGYPPYNIERILGNEGLPDRLRITLAVAGFSLDQLEITLEEGQLLVRGRPQDNTTRDYVHSGIPPRQFRRTFLLGEGMEVLGVELSLGLLAIDLGRPEPELHAARERGARAMSDLVQAEGGCLSVGQLRKLYGLTPQAIHERREIGTGLAVRFGSNEYLYPAWQFASDGTPLPGLKETLAAFKVEDPWMRLNFFLTPDSRLDGRTPLAALRAHETEAVAAAAAAFGEHGAA